MTTVSRPHCAVSFNQDVAKFSCAATSIMKSAAQCGARCYYLPTGVVLEWGDLTARLQRQKTEMVKGKSGCELTKNLKTILESDLSNKYYDFRTRDRSPQSTYEELCKPRREKAAPPWVTHIRIQAM